MEVYLAITYDVFVRLWMGGMGDRGHKTQMFEGQGGHKTKTVKGHLTLDFSDSEGHGTPN